MEGRPWNVSIPGHEGTESMMQGIPSFNTAVSALASLSKGETERTQIELLMSAFRNKNFDEFKKIIQTNKLNLNAEQRHSFYTIFGDVLKAASSGEGSLEMVEYLLHHGADVDKVSLYSEWGVIAPGGYFGRNPLKNKTPLLQIIDETHSFKVLSPLIRLLLGYGAKVDNAVLEATKNSEFPKDIMQMLTHHQELIEKAKTNPDENTLTEAISYNKPYIVKLIILTKPELLTQSDIKLAQTTSPASVAILEKGLMLKNKLAKFTELASQRIPTELAEYIKKIVSHND